MSRPNLRAMLLIVGVAIALVAIGNSVILRRTENGYGSLLLRGDAEHYLAMAQGRATTVPPPFKYRVLVPYLVGLMPCEAKLGFILITSASLFMTYVLAQVVCRRLGLGLAASAVGVLAMFTTSLHLFGYQDPYLTDSFALMALFAMLLALLDDRFALFAVASIAGILARETTVFLVPAWLVTRRWAAALALVIVGALAFVIPRLALKTPADPGGARYLAQAFREANVFGDPVRYFQYLFSTWHFLWFLIPSGIFLLPKDRRKMLGTAALLLFAGGVLSSLIATDVARMYAIMSPVVVVTSAAVYAELAERHRWAACVFVALVAAKLFLGVPNVFFEADWFLGDGKDLLYALYAAGTVFAGIVVVMLNKDRKTQVSMQAGQESG
jgi:hypothetical protein